jgi:hypothetical protein
MVPVSKKDQAYKIMQQDLDRYFDMDAKVEKRRIPGFALIKVDAEKKIGSGENPIGNEPVMDFYDVTSQDSIIHIVNMPFQYFVRLLNSWISYFFPLSINLDYSGNISLDIRNKISLNPFNPDELNKDLRKANLRLEAKETDVDVLVVREK